MVKKVKTLILKAEGGISWTKFCYWVTSACGILTLLPAEFAKAGLVMPHYMQVAIVVAGFVSFLIAGIRNRNAASPVAPVTPTEAPKA